MKEILELLQSNEFYDGDEFIQIAKGKYLLPTTFTKLKNKIIRIIKTKTNNG